MVKIIHLPAGIFNLPKQQKRNNSPEFKLNIIQAVKNRQFSAETAYLYFNIAHSGVANS